MMCPLFCCFAATYTLLNILKILIQSSVGISCTDVEGEIPHTHSISSNKMASSSPPPSLYSKPSEDLWAEWLEPLIKWQMFGLFLPGIKQTDIERIEEDKTEVDSRKMALWSKWSTVNPNGTWEDVIKALKRMKQNTLAVEIEGKLSKEQVHKGKRMKWVRTCI